MGLFDRDASLGEFFNHEVEVGFDVDGFARGLDGVCHVLQAVAGHDGDDRCALFDQAQLAGLLDGGSAGDGKLPAA